MPLVIVPVLVVGSCRLDVGRYLVKLRVLALHIYRRPSFDVLKGVTSFASSVNSARASTKLTGIVFAWAMRWASACFLAGRSMKWCTSCGQGFR